MRRPGVDMDAESETQWKVTWFPPDKAQVTRTGSEAQVRKMAQLQAEWNPIIETREIIVGDWKMVEEESGEGDG